VPCHHIRLNAKGDTVADLEERNDQQALEQAVSDWLKQAIAELEAQDEQVCKLQGLAHQ
jgi:multidrug efflux pump subunit AcrA (membrane-fusion protein)